MKKSRNPTLSILPYSIEIAHEGDAQELARLFEKARLASDGRFLPAYMAASVREGYFKKRINCFFEGGYGPEAVLFKATNPEGKIIGFCMAGPSEGYEALPSFKRGAEIHWIYTAPFDTPRGMGTALFQRAAQAMLGRDHTSLVVNMVAGKKATRAFYEERGLRFWAAITENNERNGQVFTVPCWLLGTNDLNSVAFPKPSGPLSRKHITPCDSLVQL